MNQNQIILEYLKQGNTITSAECFTLFGITKLTTRISELRKKYVIKSIKESCVNRFGQTVYFNRYSYVGEKKLISFRDFIKILTGKKI